MHSDISSQKLLASYYVTLLVIWLAGLYLLLSMGYHNSFLYLNKHYFEAGDLIMPHITQFGDSLILSSLLLLLFLPKQPSVAFTAVISVLASGIVLVMLKYLVFPDWHRPLKAIGENQGIHYVAGYVEYYKSFPSGHTTTIASAFPFIALVFSRKVIQVFIALIAALVIYSRVYLGSHFLGDVLAGTVLGTLFAVVCIHLLYPAIQTYFNKKDELVMLKIRRAGMFVGSAGLSTGILIRYVF